ncbi:MAG: aminopeptidase [Candidatus Nanohaloarchaea archaeon]|nr:aminopeptidase [Candidatus Nanohaloarchaea archaeon]
MRPDYLDDWADLLVDYSLDIDEGDRFRVSFDYDAKPLAAAVIERAADEGADVYYDINDSELDRLSMKAADEEQLQQPVPDHKLEEAEELDKRLHIRAPSNTSEMADIDPEKQQAAKQSPGRGELRKELLENTDWSLTQYPTQALAQNAGMSTEEYEEFVVEACVRDWEEETRRYQELKQIVDDASEVRIKGEKTDLSFSIDGYNDLDRVGLYSDGTANVPGGEVFTTPEKHSFEGEIYFELPAMVDGQEAKGMHLVFGDDGDIEEYAADKGEELLVEKIETDDGSSFIGEFGIGTNKGIDQATRDILFDEKIGGTIHLAVGNAYRKGIVAGAGAYDDVDHDEIGDERYDELVDETVAALEDGSYGDVIDTHPNDERTVMSRIRDRYEELEAEKDSQQNQSVVHWDMIKDLRDNGELWLDDQLILEDGEFVGLDDL